MVQVHLRPLCDEKHQPFARAISSVVERFVDIEKATGPIPVSPTPCKNVIFGLQLSLVKRKSNILE